MWFSRLLGPTERSAAPTPGPAPPRRPDAPRCGTGHGSRSRSRGAARTEWRRWNEGLSPNLLSICFLLNIISKLLLLGRGKRKVHARSRLGSAAAAVVAPANISAAGAVRDQRRGAGVALGARPQSPAQDARPQPRRDRHHEAKVSVSVHRELRDSFNPWNLEHNVHRSPLVRTAFIPAKNCPYKRVFDN